MISLHHADCFDILETLEEKSIDLVLADPPYGTTKCKWDSCLDFEKMWKALRRVAKDRAAIVMAASQPFTSQLVCSNLKGFKCEWIWEKNIGSNFGSVKYSPMKEHESILVFGHKAVLFYPIKQERSAAGKKMADQNLFRGGEGECYGSGLTKKQRRLPKLRYPRSIQRFNRQVGLHPTQKPIPLMEYMIKTYSLEGQTVLDFCMGSGTTGVAAKNLNRSFIGIEKDPKYFKIAEDRIEAAQAGSSLERKDTK